MAWLKYATGQAEKNRGISLHATPVKANKNVVTFHTKRSIMLRMQKTQILYFGILGVSLQGTSQCWQTIFKKRTSNNQHIFHLWWVPSFDNLHTTRSRCKLYSTIADEQ